MISEAMPQVTVTCRTATGQHLLQSRQSDVTAQTTHLRGSIACSLAASRLALTAETFATSSSAVVWRAPIWLVALVSGAMTTAGAEVGMALLSAPAGSQPASDTMHGGCLAGVDTSTAQSEPGTGYRLHPAAADSAIHTGALNPAAPRDGLTRVPAALGAYLADGSCSEQGANAEPWACVDSRASLIDTSRVNTYRCSCCTVSCSLLPLRPLRTYWPCGPVDTILLICRHGFPLTAARAVLSMKSKHTAPEHCKMSSFALR